MTGSLSSRITAPAEIGLPAGPSGVSWRRATAGDLDALVELHAAMAASDHPDWSETREQLAEDLEHSWVDPAADTVVGESDGDLVAYGIQLSPDEVETIARSFAFGGVRPSHRGRGIGRELLAWHRTRARQQLARFDLDVPGWSIWYVEERNPSALRLAAHVGLTPVRYSSKMQRDLADPIPDLALPEGLELVTPTRADTARLLAARNETFRDHWGSQPMAPEDWESMHAQSTSRFDLSLMALDGDRVAGFLMSAVFPEDFERQGFVGGYIPYVGVVREWRRRGVAPALLAEAFRRHRAEGFEKVGLDVDTENPTGALALYTGMGFVPVSRNVAFVEQF